MFTYLLKNMIKMWDEIIVIYPSDVIALIVLLMSVQHGGFEIYFHLKYLTLQMYWCPCAATFHGQWKSASLEIKFRVGEGSKIQNRECP